VPRGEARRGGGRSRGRPCPPPGNASPGRTQGRAKARLLQGRCRLSRSPRLAGCLLCSARKRRLSPPLVYRFAFPLTRWKVTAPAAPLSLATRSARAHATHPQLCARRSAGGRGTTSHYQCAVALHSCDGRRPCLGQIQPPDTVPSTCIPQPVASAFSSPPRVPYPVPSP